VPGHPHFRSPIAWHATIAEARQAAERGGKRVFVQVGRGSCGGSRALVEKTVAKEEIAEFLLAHFECAAVDGDAEGFGDPAAAALVAGLPRREPTPLCVYLASDGRLLHATAGGRPPAVFLTDLVEASRK
jgi:hypothetical protein